MDCTSHWEVSLSIVDTCDHIYITGCWYSGPLRETKIVLAKHDGTVDGRNPPPGMYKTL